MGVLEARVELGLVHLHNSVMDTIVLLEDIVRAGK